MTGRELIDGGLRRLAHYGTAELQALDDLCLEQARALGLDPPPTVFHLAPSEEIYDIACRGLPGRYSHWRFGQDYERQKGGYDRGESRIYELVLNTRPAHAYLLEGNGLVAQLLVIAHVLGHTHVFARNRYFEPADKGFLPRVRSAAERIRGYMAEHGREVVEDLIDDAEALSLSRSLDQLGDRFEEREPAFEQRPYDELFPDDVAERRARVERERDAWRSRFPRQPERDLLGFVLRHARLLEDWQRDVIGIVREETGYFVPQLRTKVLNEGFATWAHNRVVHALGLDTDDFLEFNRLNAAVARPHPDHPNPYHLGWIIFREIERIAADPTDEERERWAWAGEGPEAGVQRVLEVVEGYDDVALLAEFVTPRVCELAQLFAWERTPGGPERIVVTSREAEEVRRRLLALHANAGLPVVEIVDADGLGQGQLFLEHRHEGVGLDDEYARGTLRHLATLWGKPVVVRTIERREPTPVWLVAHPGRRDVERTRVEPTRAA